ncbi:BnaC01g44470D [Brassica napus]|uniref:BnaC01g44470D protein n=1 Tax=Brassica napus TaxID=3708 RepID=A0A078IM85_BRANA|nr:BnaC01g44470D [Brassica napus]
MRINFDHEIDNNPQPEEAGTITLVSQVVVTILLDVLYRFRWIFFLNR